VERSEQRHENRHEVYHPINIHVVDPERVRSSLSVRYNGFIKDLSLGGMCAYLNEGYNSLNLEELLGKRVKIEMNLLSADTRFFVLGKVRWGTREGQAENVVMLGIQLVEVTDFHLKSITQLLAVSANDHNMLWDLWDNLMVNV